ncbi:unnamed protein product [Chilo suppressalis]|uniref:Uncharacterized protein n=1 Tax=Chilo suppressalis TaxID=168631 RepID=A0ABN8B9Y9_CHISP|nr:hypothetical protein evm_004830 [Chilo suppressalis]CAH0405432.1 unnamed protein product [Chilo suppressalis]
MHGSTIIYLFSIIGIIYSQSYGTSYSTNRFYSPNQYNAKRLRPSIKVYYESQCPACKALDSTYFADVVKTLGPYLDIYTNPYGKAETLYNNNGSIEFQCQHGPVECYGNKLHACALDNIPNRQQALLFNGCMMEAGRPDGGSNDESADQCGALMSIDANAIKSCAKSQRSSVLLSNYGIETKAANIKWLPTVRINDVEWNGTGDGLMAAVCAAFTNPPAQCRGYI